MTKTGHKVLLSIVVAAVIIAAAIWGLASYLNSQSRLKSTEESPPPTNNAVVTPTNQAPANSDTTPQTPPAPAPSTYKDAQNRYQFSYDSSIKVGAKAPNSVLGTYDEPVSGIYVGQYVFIPTTTPALRQAANDYIQGFYKDAFESQAEALAYLKKQSGPAAACYKVSVPSEQQLTILAVSCLGEGGEGFYALVKGPSVDIFIDGYSKGYSPIGEDQGTISWEQLRAVLASLAFF